MGQATALDPKADIKATWATLRLRMLRRHEPDFMPQRSATAVVLKNKSIPTVHIDDAFRDLRIVRQQTDLRESRRQRQPVPVHGKDTAKQR